MAIGTPYQVLTTRTVNTSTNSDASFTTNVQADAGDTLFIWVASRIAAAAISSVSGITTSYTPEIITRKRVASNVGISVYRVRLSANVTSSTAVTVTLDTASSNRKVVGCFAVPGILDHTPDVNTGNDSGTGTPSAGSGSASQANSIMLAFWEHNAANVSDTGLPSASFTEIDDWQGGSTNSIQGYTEYQIMSSIASVSPTFTPSGTTTTAYSGVLLGYLQLLISGTASSTSASSGTGTGTATHHQYSGTATGTSASSGAATGTATHHQYSGTATSTSASSGAATGTDTDHQYSGTADGTSASSGAATGEVTVVVNGSGDGTTVSDGTAIGQQDTVAAAAGGYFSHLGRVIRPDVKDPTTYGRANGLATTRGNAAGGATPGLTTSTASGDSVSHGHAGGVASPHPYDSTADGYSTTSGKSLGVESPHLVFAAAHSATLTPSHARGAVIDRSEEAELEQILRLLDADYTTIIISPNEG